MIDFSALKAITIPEGAVKQIKVGGNVIWKQMLLPAGYQKLEYIEVTGTQYIDTGFTPNHNSRMVLDFAMTQTENTSAIIGSRRTTSARAFAFSASSAGEWKYGYGPATHTVGNSDLERHIMDANKNVISIDGITTTVAAAEFAGAYTMQLGAVIGNAGIYYGYGRIYSCKLYDNGTLVRDYVPCINASGEVGMYDVLSGVFYGNAGTGAFVTGKRA